VCPEDDVSLAVLELTEVYARCIRDNRRPTAEERKQVPHHLIDIFDLHEPVDVHKFLALADAAIEGVASRGALPCVVGGSGLYLKSLLYGMDDLPADAALRRKLDKKYDNPAGFEALKKLMAQKDPAAHARWKAHRRKLIRALEVLTVTGKSITSLQSGEKPLRYHSVTLLLSVPREELKARIERRTDAMLQNGWIEEAERAIKNGILTSPTAHQALGYNLIGDYLAGRLNYAEMREKIVTRTWQFARRQLTWFRHQHPEALSVTPLQAEALDIGELFAGK